MKIRGIRTERDSSFQITGLAEHHFFFGYPAAVDLNFLLLASLLRLFFEMEFKQNSSQGKLKGPVQFLAFLRVQFEKFVMKTLIIMISLLLKRKKLKQLLKMLP